jgi:hypothetical protein
MINTCANCGKELFLDKETKNLYRVFEATEMYCDVCSKNGNFIDQKNKTIFKNKNTNIRSIEQNKYYWGIIIRFIMKFRGWNEKQAHAWVKCTWNIETTQNLTTVKFEDIMASLRQLVFKFWGLNIPQPNDDLEYLGGRYEWEELYLIYNPVAKPDPSS